MSEDISSYSRYQSYQNGDPEQLKLEIETEEQACTGFFGFNVWFTLVLSLFTTLPVFFIPICSTAEFPDTFSRFKFFINVVNFLAKDFWMYLVSIFSCFAIYILVSHRKTSRFGLSIDPTQNPKLEHEKVMFLSEKDHVFVEDVETPEFILSKSQKNYKNFVVPNVLLPWIIVSFSTVVLPSLSNIIEYTGVDTPTVKYLRLLSNILYETKGVYVLCALLSTPRDDRLYH
ncbi:hypothetical protein AYI68_g4343 [Smittium mucronatum]|uniref:Uncharacterized protein n=1 Tax=Smittium mucronatum TaxID=133383 RepID=A0A1R0GXD0_9FUNG|nr:hypothetical protein AYI68_g4343 [Smittium mucronatum]